MRLALLLGLLAALLAGCGGSSGRSNAAKNIYAKPALAAHGQKLFSAPGMAIHFDFPPSFKVVALAPDQQVAGNNRHGTHAGLSVGPYDLLTVTRYPGLKTPVTAQNIKSLKAAFDADVSQVLHRSVSSSVSQAGSIPLLTWPRERVVGLPVTATVQILNAFVGDDEYEIQCQATPARLALVETACREAAATLRAA